MTTFSKLFTASLVIFLLGRPSETPKPKPNQAESSKPKAKRVPKATKKLAKKAYNTFGPLPKEAEGPATTTPEQVSLGRLLYHDARLSKNHDISCNSCHDLQSGFGADGEATSPGHKGQRGERNSPSTLNAALQLTQFWDARAKDVEEQAISPILNLIMPCSTRGLPKVFRLLAYLKASSRQQRARRVVCAMRPHRS